MTITLRPSTPFEPENNDHQTFITLVQEVDNSKHEFSILRNIKLFDSSFLYTINSSFEYQFPSQNHSTLIKCCVVDVNVDLYNLIKTCDSLLTISVRQHLAEKLKPIFSNLDVFQGVSESYIPKQGRESARTFGVGEGTEGEDDNKQKPKSDDPKDNVALVSIGKEKIMDDDDNDEEEEEEDENVKIRCKARRAKIDENHRIVREA
ncbi:unnamed protein product [Lactuca saligna]|uniref:Uncharacterized protein n=1 Tax=Lactuca saligna TaxID=75948 RepID=A0AA36EHQ2_LACSI|nr:unnamed protein product [Lactuca saligna]